MLASSFRVVVHEPADLVARVEQAVAHLRR
jgi:hypothetical protein